MQHPHFDDGLIVWSDAYSGKSPAPSAGYSSQFDLQWKIALEGNPEYYVHPGASVDDAYIEDRVYEWTGIHPRGKKFSDPSAGTRVLDHPLNADLIRGKTCIDIGCGMGRWTKAMQAIGAASVLSVDMSESALNSVQRFNSTVLRADIMRLPEEHPELGSRFDFANFWGVAMCTHNPQKAFMSAASTVKPGGALYLMVYCPEGMHNTQLVNAQRKHFHRLQNIAERLAYVDHVYERSWDGEYPFIDNVKNLIRRIIGAPKGGKVGVLDMLEPLYNWVIPLDVIEGWMTKAGFSKTVLLNEFERDKCAYHVLGIKSA